jgi:hypothetical protein
MAESTTHKRAKSKAAGKSGRTEVPISRGRRLDAVTGSKAIEIETSGQPARLERAAQRLKASRKTSHVLVVPQRDMRKAAVAMRSVRTSGTVRNLSGTHSNTVSFRVNARTAKKSNPRRTRGTSKVR